MSKLNILIFSISKNTANYKLKCEYLCDKLNTLGYNCHNYTSADLNINFLIYDFIILSKYQPDFEKIKLKKNCKIIFELIDLSIFLDRTYWRNDLNYYLIKNKIKYLVFPNNYCKTNFQKYFNGIKKSFSIYMHGDKNFTKNKVNNKLRIGYAGFGRDLPNFLRNNNDINIFTKYSRGDKKDWLYQDSSQFVNDFGSLNSFFSNINCHISIAEDTKDKKFWSGADKRPNIWYVPNAKISCASRTNSVIICTRHPGCYEVLGDDYPYYTLPDEKSVLKTIDYVKKTYNKNEWFKALKIINETNHKTDINYNVYKYIKIFEYHNKK